MVQRRSHITTLDVLFLPRRLGDGWSNRLEWDGQPVTPSSFLGVQEDTVEHAKKPTPHTAVPSPEMALSQRSFEAVLHKIISGIGVAQERARIPAQMRNFAGNQPLEFIHEP
jgi:hypothetical protein